MKGTNTLVLVQDQWEPNGLATEFRRFGILVLVRVLAPAYFDGPRVPQSLTSKL